MKNNYFKHLLKHSSIYGAGEILNKALGFVLIPVYTRYLSTEIYGTLQIFLITANLLATFLQLGLGSAILKTVLHEKNIDKNEAYSTAFYFLLLVNGIVVCPIFFISDSLSLFLTETSQHGSIVQLLVIAIVFKNLAIIPIAKLRIEDHSTKFSIINSLKFLVQLLLTIYFVMVQKEGIKGIIIADLISAVIFSLPYLKILLSNLKLFFSVSQLKGMLLFGLPLVPAAIAMFVIDVSDRYFLRYFSTLEEVGLYSLGYRFGMIIAFIVAAFQRVWGAAMFKISKEENANVIYATNFTYFLLILNFVALALSVFSKDLIYIFATEAYYESFKIVPFISFSYIFFGIYYYTAIGLNLKRKTHLQFIVVLVSCLLNIILNFGFIPTFGMIGAAITTLITFIFMAFTATKVSQHFYFVRYEWSRIGTIFLFSVIITIISFIFNFGSIGLSILFNSGLLLSFPAILFFTGFFNKTEKTILLDKLKLL